MAVPCQESYTTGLQKKKTNWEDEIASAFNGVEKDRGRLNWVQGNGSLDFQCSSHAKIPFIKLNSLLNSPLAAENAVFMG